MRDMTRDELQDCLPDLLHGRLPADEAAALERAVAADPDLLSELALLRAIRAAHAAAPTIDVSRIVAALPTPPAAVLAPEIDDLAARRESKRQWISHRFARAAALLVVVGGGTMLTVYAGRDHTSSPLTPNVRAESVAVAATSMQLGLGAATDELSVEQLRALEADIQALDGVPSADPDMGADLLAGEGA